MFITAIFEYSEFLELAISELEQNGILRNRIVAIPLDKKVEKRKILDTIHRADGVSQIDGAMVLGAVFMELGVVYGYFWKLGPVLWGLIGLGLGIMLGFLLDYYVGKLPGTGQQARQQDKNVSGNKAAEVVLIIHCEENQGQLVEEILWDNLSLGVGKLNTP
ncbi:MAG: hypothetical protein ABRQ26_16635 [Syntrophomonadaceae bacterium]